MTKKSTLPVIPLSPEQIRLTCDPAQFSFKTTNELEPLTEYIGQERAVEAIEFGVGIKRHGYNIFVLGSSGTGKHTLVDGFVRQQAADEPTPSDWCYVNNFVQPYRPTALQLPTGMGKQLQNDMETLVDELRSGLSSALENEEYVTRRQVLESDFRDRQQKMIQIVQDSAQEQGLTLLRTPAGLAFAPVKDGNVITQEEFQKLPDEERKAFQTIIDGLQVELQDALQKVPNWQRELRQSIRELRREVTSSVITNLLDELRKAYAEQSGVLDYLQALETNISDNLQDFLRNPEADEGGGGKAKASKVATPILGKAGKNPALRRYEVNVLVDSSEANGAPVIYENNPSYLNVVGRIEQMAQMGALITDFTLIKPGKLHAANGGYLLLDAQKVLTSPYAWEGIKRALQSGEVRIESPGQMLSMTSTISLEPEPIPLNVKVILLGDRRLYYMLAQADPEFHELFKVAADFNEVLERNPENQLLYARLIAGIVQREGLKPFNKAAVARIIEYSARFVSDSERMTARMQSIVDLLEEAEYWGQKANAKTITAKHVQQAIDAQIRRLDRTRERMQEQVLRETILIDTTGEKIGQVNGLAVLQLGNFAFGKVSRISARVRLGSGEVIDIEREVRTGGPSHSKGVLILSSYLGARYAQDTPLSLTASLVFEQSYGGVDGDSASSTELYALLSAIAEAPINQALAVTGSVNQYGEVQAIGGANEKIEGFFDLCNERGLTGEQGVLIPASNVKHLMLRQDIVDAVKKKKFNIYPVETIDQGITILTGLPAGEADADGIFPEGTINRMVADRLVAFAEKRLAFDKRAFA